MNNIFFPNANSNETYFTIHNVKEAHSLSLGKGVKVGIIDWLFNFSNSSLYSGFANISTIEDQLQMSGHGFWMATTLREIAPECEIYAINAIDNNNEDKRVTLFEKAIEWAINNKIDILTYSHATFSEKENKVRSYNAIEKAYNAGIITTFIHCDSPKNIWPNGCCEFWGKGFDRLPDVNILHYDYNILLLQVYERYAKIIASNGILKSGDDIPFFSFSSMSVVLGGFIALIKACKPELNSKECRKLLIDTSYPIIKKGNHWYDINPCKHCVDIGKAIKVVCSNNRIKENV